MDLKELKEKVKEIAIDSGAKLVGVGSRERLKEAPPSGNMDYCLPGAQSCIIWAFPFSWEALKAYFSKKERISIKKEMYLAYSTGWKIAKVMAAFIEANSEYKAFPLIPNGRYREGMGIGADSSAGRLKMRLANYIIRLGLGGNLVARAISKVFGKEMLYPDFSLRYGAVAAGLGHLGWSGNLVTKEFGGALILGGVLTMAPLEPDSMASENNCNKCKICVNVCNSQFFSLKEEEAPVSIGDQQEAYSKRSVFARCGMGCSGLAGLSSDGNWSIWSPNHISLANVSEEYIKDPKYRAELMKNLLYTKKTPKTVREYNRKIIAEFSKGGLFVNVGLRSLANTNPRCGFCSMICVGDFTRRKELYDMLKTSGHLFIDAEGREYIKKN